MPRGTTFELIAAWILLTEGGLGLLFLPVIVFSAQASIAPAKIWAFGGISVACLVGGALLYTRWTWSWWLALAVAIGAGGWLLASGGLNDRAQGAVAVAFGAVEVLFLVLGRRAAGHPDAMALASARIPFRLKVALVWGSFFFLIVVILVVFNLDVPWIRDNASYIAGGVIFTLGLALGAIILAVALALVGALGRLSRNPVAYGLSGFYTSFFRGTPLIVQLFLIYQALPQIGTNLQSRSLVNVLTLTTFQAGLIGLGLNYGAYMTEIFRAGIQSVGHGQAEAADALGMSYLQRMRRVVLPQATRVIIPPTGNDFISMMKDTALVSVLGVELSRAELFRRAQLLGGQDLRRLEALLVAAGMYWGLTAIFTFFQAKLERRMSKGYVRLVDVSGKPRPRLLSAGAAKGAGEGALVVVDVPASEAPEEVPP